MRNKIFFLGLLYLLCSSSLYAQKTPPVIASSDKSKILLGEQFDIVIGARFTDEASLAFFNIDSLPHFEIVQKAKIDTERTDKNIVLTQKITLTSFDSGRWQIPAIPLPGTNLKTKPITIDVAFTSPFDPNQEYHDVKDILGVKKPTESQWYWYLIGAILLLLLFLLLFPRKKKNPNEIKLDANAYRTAIADLQKLKKEELAEKDVKAFYVRLVDVFRTYLDKGKGLQSFSKTTDDLSMQVLDLNLRSDTYNELVQTLRLSDAVKYAKFAPNAEENNYSLEIIQRTIEAIERR
jgi:LPXTG-motif cell wall-anchored protein